jgi:superfamily II DNA helicase RecQ
MALTATAVDTVRLDISQTLTLKNPLVATNSVRISQPKSRHTICPYKTAGLTLSFMYRKVDRPNLKITACKKRGKESDLSLIAERVKATSGSTIVYVPTIRETEEVSEALRQKFKVNRTTNRSGEPKQMLTVGTYHGSLPHIQRKQTHHDFLTGVCRVVVATTAFGMGIDKHDIRLVVHYGSPKTMEEYYQQIGRAGRDGVLSLCLMLYGESDFVKYQSDFYVGKLSAEAKLTQKKSTDALERFSRDPTACRRAGILQHFGEKEPGVWKTSPEDGKKVCGTCDNCVRVFSADEGGKTLRREFTLEAVPVLLAIGKGFGGGGVSMSHVVALATDSAPPANGRLPANGVRETIRVVRTMLDPVTRSSVFAKEITMSLVSHGFLKKATVKGGYSSFEVFHVTPIGAAVANAAFCVFSDANFGSLDAKDLRATAEQAMTQHLPTKESRVFLPIPEAVQRAETECKVAADAKIDELKKSGVDVSSIPQQELDAGVGPALNAELQWARNLRTHRNAGRDEKATALQTLLQRIETWRDATADLLNIAPTAVFPSHVAKRVAYACASSAGMPLDVESLRSAGVRVVGAAGLVLVIQQALSELGLGRPLGVSDADDVASDGQQKCTYMKHGVLTPTTPWLFALYKPRKKKGVPDQPPTWEVSYDRFVKKNESPSAIAMTQDTGRAVQVGTVVGHLLEALVQGKPVDMRRVVQSVGSDFFPSRVEWRSLETACGNASQNPVGDPALFSQKEILRDGLILGPETVDKDREMKTEEEKEKERVWYDKIRAFVALKRSGIEPEWEHGDERDAKRVKI